MEQNTSAHGEPDADVLRSFGERPASFGHQLLSVEADLDPVVDEREEWRDREGNHENGDEAELEHHLEVLVEESLVRDHPVVVQPARHAFILLADLLKALLEQMHLVPPGLQLTTVIAVVRQSLYYPYNG